MIKVETARPCDGRKGSYELLVQYLSSRRHVASTRLALPKSNSQVEAHMAQADPFALLALAETVQANTSPRKLLSDKVPAALTVIRRCNLLWHRDGSGPYDQVSRPEVALRAMFVQANHQPIAVYPKTLELDHQNVGNVRTVNSAIHAIDPVISVPVTRDELHLFRQSANSYVVPLQPSTSPETMLYGVRYPATTGQVIEVSL